MHRTVSALLATLALLATPAAQAQLTLSCSVVAAPVLFGTVDPSGASASPGTGTVTVSCVGISLSGVSYEIALSTGNGTYAQRQMLSGGSTLNYNIYTASNYQTVWGDGSAGTARVSGGLTVLVSLRSHTAYGRIPGSQNVPAGTYTDQLTVTVTY